MGFALASAWVDIGAHTGGAEKGIAGVKKSLANLQPQFEAMQRIAAWAFGGLTAAAGFSIKAAADEEAATVAMKSALEATGQEVDGNLGKFKALAENIATTTVNSKESTEGLIAFATNLGVTADNMSAVIKAGTGLGTAFFGGDQKAGVEAMAKAQQGNFRELERMVPGMKAATTAQGKLDAAMKAGMRGFQEAQDQTHTLWGSLKQLGNRATELAAGFGEALAPAVERVSNWLIGLAETLQQMSPATKQHILQWAGIAAAIGGVILLGPKIGSMFSGIVSTFMGIGKLVFSLGSTIVSAMFGPLGIVIGAVAGLATAFAYLIGSGRTATERISSGFGDLLKMISFVLDNSSSLGEAWSLLMSEFGFRVETAWATAIAGLFDAWLGFRHFIIDLWNNIGDWIIGEAFEIAAGMKAAFIEAGEYIGRTFRHMGDYLYRALIALKQAHGSMTQKQADEQTIYIDRMEATEDAASRRGADEQKKAAADANAAKQDYLKKYHAKSADLNARSLQEERQANGEWLAGQLATNEAAQKDFEAKQKAKQKASGTKSMMDQLKDLQGTLSKAMGIDDLLATADKIGKLAGDMKAQSMGALAGGNVKVNVATGKIETSSVEESFKKNLSGQFEGMQMRKRDGVQQNHTTAMQTHASAMNKFSQDMLGVAQAWLNAKAKFA